jgi:hypothetical protein
VPIAWHSSGSDPYYTSEAGSRWGYYGNSGYPTMLIDGYDKLVGAYTNNDTQYNWYMSYYNAHHNISSPMTITYLSKSYGSGKASISVQLYNEQSIPTGSTCWMVLWEDNLNYSGRPQGYVERSAYSTAVLISDPGNTQIVSKEFTLNGGWVLANLGVSVFVQDPNKNILQGKATKLALGTGVAPSSLGKVKALFN